MKAKLNSITDSGFIDSSEFEKRHIGPSDSELKQMLEAIGMSSLEQLMQKTLPSSIFKQKLLLPSAMTEKQYLEHVKRLAEQNQLFKSYIGYGFYNVIIPSVIQRNILENPGWYTQYTPYQAEISQGRLESLLNFQTMITDLTKMEVANASLLDEATAAAEAMTMAYRIQNGKVKRTEQKRAKFFVDKLCYGTTIDVLQGRAEAINISIDIGDYAQFGANETYFGALVQHPNSEGEIHDLQHFVKECHAKGILVIFATDLLALCLLAPPGDLGADIVIGNAQRFGVPMGYGGPHPAFLATKQEFIRQLPGRIIGVSKDINGKPAYRMTLQTREQHIKKERATSNICTAQALLAIIASMYAVYHGANGLHKIATRVYRLTALLKQILEQAGYTIQNNYFFDTLKITFKDSENNLIEKIKKKALGNKINLRYDVKSIFISLDETVGIEELKSIIDIFTDKNIEIKYFDQQLPTHLTRKIDYLKHSVFNSYHSETTMLRYIKFLENKDLSLTHSMIPLGSCTMKLNATTEMLPISWYEFANIHPFVPVDQVGGYQQVIAKLSEYLKAVTGFDAISFQSNSGAQGEYAGLKIVKAYFKDKNQEHRNIAFIPSSAHGTNSASAALCGMEIVPVPCNEKGNINIAELETCAKKYSHNLAVLMVTYPSTHGVFEKDIQKVCHIIHSHGGQVYMDGANMNAQVGITSPIIIGADLCHLNLHKTFSIPHGGGGPGMGPICVAKHLTPYLPSHCIIETNDRKTAIPAICATPYGSASILLISYGYFCLLGQRGCTNASKYAILNANYIMSRLAKEYKILYKGEHNFIAHEFIIDVRFYKKFGIEAMDIAKRLMDYGFHAPTVSFPVPGSLMIEPTECESKTELDRFCEAMLEIKKEIEEVVQNQELKNNSLLKNAPHTAEVCLSNNWNYPYSREQAAYPLPTLRDNKFWPTVSRIDEVYGDRNLVCNCI